MCGTAAGMAFPRQAAPAVRSGACGAPAAASGGCAMQPSGSPRRTRATPSRAPSPRSRRAGSRRSGPSARMCAAAHAARPGARMRPARRLRDTTVKPSCTWYRSLAVSAADANENTPDAIVRYINEFGIVTQKACNVASRAPRAPLPRHENHVSWSAVANGIFDLCFRCSSTKDIIQRGDTERTVAILRSRGRTAAADGDYRCR